MSIKLEIPSYTESEIKENPWIEHLELKLWNILASVVESPSTDLSQAAAEINALYPPNRNADLCPNNEKHEGFLAELWEMFRITAAQIPPFHPAQERLIDLIRALREIPPIEVVFEREKYIAPYEVESDSDDSDDSDKEDDEEETASEDGDSSETESEDMYLRYTYKLWTDLPALGTVLSDAPYNAESGIGVESFIARLIAAGLITDFWWVAQLTFTEALEPIKQNPCTGPHLDEYVPEAVVWVRLAGAGLYEACLNEVYKESSYETGGVWDGHRGFSKGRWGFWKRRFGEIAGDGRVTQETRELAGMAKEIMDGIDGSS